MKLAIKNISVELSGKKILKDISLEVEEGMLISLLGASGCGKSTLLKTIAGIIPQTKGNIFLGDMIADNLEPHKRGTVIVFQDLRLFPHMTVLENVSFALKMKGMPKPEYNKIAREALEKVKLEGFENRKTREMSGGQMQRVALARAFAARPNILLLDEPFSSLDENLRQDMRTLLLELQREYKITTILVTHDREEALSLSEKIALMKDGEILQYDTPKKIYTSPNNRDIADFFGDNIYIQGSVERGIFKSEYLEFQTKKIDGAYSLMFRTKDISFSESETNKEFRVKAIFYKGNSYDIVLENEYFKDALGIKISSEKSYEVGETVYLKFNTKNALFFNDKDS